jgi:outer membrane protein OmpA-like peptidoglycan-associated protein
MNNCMWIRSAGIAAAALLLSGAALAQEMEFQIELMGPLGTKTSHKGDRVFGRVAQPDGFKGDTVEGTVKDVRSGGKLRGNSVLNFSFETLTHAGQQIPINTQVRSFRNSQGQADVDDEGRIIRQGGGNTGKALGGTAAGGLIGGLAGGLKGAAIGAGVGAAASIAVIEIAADSPEIRFNPGSIIIVSAKARSGPALTDFAGGAPPSAPTAVNSAPAAAPAPSRAAAPAAAPAAETAAAPASGAQPDFTTLKDEFIPGSKILLYDDFTDMSPDEAPPHWKVRGASLTLMAAGGTRQVSATQGVEMTPMVTPFPANFTVETEMKIDVYCTSTWLFYGKDKEEQLHVYTESRPGDNRLRVIARTSEEAIVDAEFPVDLDQPIKEAIWVQNGRLRVFLNGQRVVDANQLKIPALDHALLQAEPSQGNPGSKLSYRMFRIAESTPDFSRTIQSAGRFVTYGILFDTDSDRIKPESAASIKSIAFGLEATPELKVLIEGHTDSTGNAEHNLDLSKRRAEAVKAVLVSEFKIDAARLSAAGMGATKPVGQNDTPQGRAQNRRVELVKQ